MSVTASVLALDDDDEDWETDTVSQVEVPCCSGLCYDKLAGGAAGVMLTSLLILLLWYLAMSMCATMVSNDPVNGPGINMFVMILLMITTAWICLRICFGPGEDQFRAIAIILMFIWLLWMAKNYFGGTDVSPMGCEFEVTIAADEDVADPA